MNTTKRFLVLLPLLALGLIFVRGHSARVPLPPNVKPVHSQGVHSGHSSMALNPAGYQTVNPQPGAVSAQGSFVPVTGANATYGGATQYSNGTAFLTFYNGTWFLGPTANASGTPSYSASGTTTSFPLTGWNTASGPSPAPTFTAISGGASASVRRRPPIFF